jgi:enoyl-CoA hydratase/carnithine racemase
MGINNVKSTVKMNMCFLDLINELNAYILSLKDDRDTKAVVFKSSDSTFFLAHLDITLINGTVGGGKFCSPHEQKQSTSSPVNRGRLQLRYSLSVPKKKKLRP